MPIFIKIGKNKNIFSAIRSNPQGNWLNTGMSGGSLLKNNNENIKVKKIISSESKKLTLTNLSFVSLFIREFINVKISDT